MSSDLRFSTLLGLIVGMALATIAFSDPLPPWIPLPLLALALWRLLPAWQGRRPPVLPQRVKIGTIVLLALALWSTGRMGLGIDGAGAGFIILLWSKLLEMHQRRDLHATCAIALFVVAAELLVSQSLAQCLFAVLASLTLLSVLVQVNLVGLVGDPLPATAPWPTWVRAGRVSSVLALQAAPFALLLFLCVPRPAISPGLDTKSVQTGVSDRLAAGGLSELVLSQQLAFRVTFLSDLHPEPAQCYWRGVILTDTDGQIWWRNANVRNLESHDHLADDSSAAIDYEITLLPTNHPWLFTLDCPAAIDRATGSQTPIVQRAGFVFQCTDVIGSTRVYRGHSRLVPASDPVHSRIASESYRVPNYRTVQGEVDPEVLAVAREIAQRSQVHGKIDARRAITNTLDYFARNHFVYTLRPGSMGADAMATFLLHSRRGFCEHYASAFTLLMRLMDLDARVVVGYWGGEWNPLGNFMTVRQSNAHAWSEVHVPGVGWVRVDPTTMVEAVDTEGNVVPSADASDARSFHAASGTWMARHLQWVSQRWDFIEAQWDRWALAYDADSLADLEHRVGLGHLGPFAPIAMLCIGGTPLVLLIMWVLRRRGRVDPAQRQYRRLCARLARAGLPRQPHEGPLAYAARAAACFPELAAVVEEAATLYARLRYGPSQPPPERQAALARLARLVRRVRPGRGRVPVAGPLATLV